MLIYCLLFPNTAAARITVDCCMKLNQIKQKRKQEFIHEMKKTLSLSAILAVAALSFACTETATNTNANTNRATTNTGVSTGTNTGTTTGTNTGTTTGGRQYRFNHRRDQQTVISDFNYNKKARRLNLINALFYFARKFVSRKPPPGFFETAATACADFRPLSAELREHNQLPPRCCLCRN